MGEKQEQISRLEKELAISNAELKEKENKINEFLLAEVVQIHVKCFVSATEFVMVRNQNVILALSLVYVFILVFLRL